MASPDSDDASNLHQHFLNGDRTAFARIAEQYIQPLVQGLKRQFLAQDIHILETAVDDALLDYFFHPEKFDPTKGSLKSYLAMAAYRDCQNAIKPRKLDKSLVELDAAEGEYSIEIADETDWEAIVLDRNSPVWTRLHTLLDDPTDEKFAKMMLDGERRTSEYAHELGIEDLSIQKQEEIVKRNKDRLKILIKRHIDQAEFRDE